MSERTECRHQASAMITYAEDRRYEGGAGAAAIAAAIFELAGAVWEMVYAQYEIRDAIKERHDG